MFDKFKNYHTFVEKVNPVIKLFIAVLLFPFVIFIHNPNQMFWLVVSFLLLLVILSGVKLRFLLAVLLFNIALGLISSVYMIFYGEGSTTIFEYGMIHITEESLIRGIHIMMRGLVLSLYGSLFIVTTNITDVFYSLMQQLKLNPKFAYSFMAGIRMAPIIFNEYVSLRNARIIRKQVVSKKYVSGIRGFINLIVTLLSQSIRRAIELGIAMEAKGFHNGQRSYYKVTRYSLNDLIFLIIVCVISILSIYIGNEILLISTKDVR